MPFSGRDPFEAIETLLERMGREFDPEAWPVGAGVPVDVVDDGDRYLVTVDLPGYEEDDVDVRLAAGELHIDAEREAEEGEETVDYLRRERHHHSASRRVAIPDPVDEDGVTATLDRGVLTVELPKREPNGGTRIVID